MKGLPRPTAARPCRPLVTAGSELGAGELTNLTSDRRAASIDPLLNEIKIRFTSVRQPSDDSHRRALLNSRV
jgi:hypothetical protein